MSREKVMAQRVENAREFLDEIKLARMTHTDAVLIIPPNLCALINDAAWRAILDAGETSKGRPKT